MWQWSAREILPKSISYRTSTKWTSCTKKKKRENNNSDPNSPPSNKRSTAGYPILTPTPLSIITATICCKLWKMVVVRKILTWMKWSKGGQPMTGILCGGWKWNPFPSSSIKVVSLPKPRKFTSYGSGLTSADSTNYSRCLLTIKSRSTTWSSNVKNWRTKNSVWRRKCMGSP